MLDVSSETNVKFLREAVKYLQEQLLAEKKKNLAHAAQKALDDELCTKLSDELLALKLKFFVGGREKAAPDTRAGRPKARGTLLPHNRSPLDGADVPQPAAAELNAEEVFYTDDNAVCPCCSSAMAPMTGGFEESCEIDVTERKYRLRHHRRQKYVCKDCSKIVAAKGPTKLTPGSEFSIQMAVQVADDKYGKHMPLTRQADAMAEAGLTVTPRTLFGLTRHLESLLAGVPAMIRAEILARPSVAIDETRMKILSTKTNGYVWGLTNSHGVYYQYETTRSGQVAREMLGNYRGTVMTDGFSGYRFLEKVPGISLVHCMAHVRRRFHEASAKYPEAKPALEMLDELFAVEAEAGDVDDIARLRREKSAAIVARFEAYLDSRRGLFLSSSGFGAAVTYYDERREQLTRFLSDPNAPLDSNSVERALKRPVLGRKNFLGFRTINGADVGMTLYTIVATCKLLGLSTAAYMRVMATRAARGEAVLTPLAWGTELAEKAKAGMIREELFPEPA
jgi:transposase